MSLSEERLREIEARAKSATEGPWFGSAGGRFVYGATPGDEVAKFQRHPDAEFARHARTDVPDLLAEVKRLREGIEMLVEHPTWHRGMYGCPRDMVSTDRLTDLLNPTEGEADERLPEARR